VVGVGGERLLQLQLPPDIHKVRAIQQYEAALSAIDAIEDGKPWSQWIERGWLHPHVVSVVKLHGKPWHQVIANRLNRSRPKAKPPAGPIEPAPGGGEINRLRAWQDLHRFDTPLSGVTVPHWFYAQVLARAVIVRQYWWRVYPLRNELPVGRTRVGSLRIPRRSHVTDYRPPRPGDGQGRLVVSAEFVRSRLTCQPVTHLGWASGGGRHAEGSTVPAREVAVWRSRERGDSSTAKRPVGWQRLSPLIPHTGQS
jgi:hypothetical protein